MFGVKILEERSSKYNKDIKVIKSWGMGTYIQVNGLTQSGGILESIWNSTLKFLKRRSPVINNVLILGLGGGTVAKLILKYWKDAKITGIEIDKNMIELGEKYLGLNTNKVKVIIGDAKKYLAKKSGYDLIVVDTYLGDKYVEMKEINSGLSNIFIFNRLFYEEKKQEAINFGKKLEKKFKKVEVFYPQANLMFICYN